MEDWASFIQGLSPQWTWRTGTTIFWGSGVYAGSSVQSAEIRSAHWRRQRKALRPRGATLEDAVFCRRHSGVRAGSLNPRGMILLALSAAASTFGGTSCLLWRMKWLKGTGSLHAYSQSDADPQKPAVDCDCLRACPCICDGARSGSAGLRLIRKLGRTSAIWGYFRFNMTTASSR